MRPISRKEEIIKTAAALFKKRGYNAVSMRDLAFEMDIKAASLYNHISGKQEILSLLILEVAEAFSSGMDRIKSQQISNVEKIKKLIELHIDITIEHSGGLASLNNDWMHLEGPSLEFFINMRDDYEEDFRTIIKEGITVGELRPYHPEVVLFSILSTLRTLYLWHEKRGKLEVNVLKKEMVSVLMKGIV